MRSKTLEGAGTPDGNTVPGKEEKRQLGGDSGHSHPDGGENGNPKDTVVVVWKGSKKRQWKLE